MTKPVNTPINTPANPPKDCQLCPRLADYRDENARKNPDWFNGAVPCFGADDARLLIVGLAPGVTGANRTGRPFTGDWAGDLLYATLAKYGFSNDRYDKHAEDGLTLLACMITNAVRCVPPQNKPVGAEITMCRQFLKARLGANEKLQAVVCLGRIAHESVLRALDVGLKDAPFAHGARHRVGGINLYDSYHCSRYNTNTGRLTVEMFEAVFEAVRKDLI